MTRACLVFGCGDPVTARGRCARHGHQVDAARSLNSDRRLGAALYASREWRQVRARVLALHPWCECAVCVAGQLRARSRVVHHTLPHGGDRARFFDEANLQALSKPCHDRITATISSRRGVGKTSAEPIAVKPWWRVARVAGGLVQGPAGTSGAIRG